MIEQGATRDTGLVTLVMLLRFHEIGADVEQIRHRFGSGAAIGIADMLRCARELGLKARCVTSDWRRLARTPLPAIAERRDGGFFILAKVADGRVLVQDPLNRQPMVIERAQLEAEWDGRLVLFARRAALTDLSRRFDVTWFLQATLKYRRLLGEVL
jgi:subfamily B ATP-binding cassette protein HlyB/CyaB